jgi:hypothetical protein
MQCLANANSKFGAIFWLFSGFSGNMEVFPVRSSTEK